MNSLSCFRVKQKAPETITEMEEEVADAKHKLGEVETAALRFRMKM